MTTRYRLLTIIVLAGLLLALTAPVIALAQGPGPGSMADTPAHRGGDHRGPGRGGHYGGGQYGSLGAFANALNMAPWSLTAAIENGQTITELARARGINRNTLVDSVVGQTAEWLEGCLQAGHMTQSQYAWMHERLEEHIGWLADNPQALFFERHHGVGFGLGWGHGFGGLIWAAAEVLEISPWEIRYELYEGQTIAEIAQQIATEEGVDVNTLVDSIVQTFLEPRVEALNAAVAVGRLTQEQADYLLAEMEEQARWLIENTPPMGQFGHGYGGGCH